MRPWMRAQARDLRKNATKEERKLWYRFLRTFPLPFRRQAVFGPYIVDFYCPAAKLVVELGYSVDYEDEKEDFEPDGADTVELINGERMPWEQVRRDGIDYIALYYVNEKGKQVQILDAELA